MSKECREFVQYIGGFVNENVLECASNIAADLMSVDFDKYAIIREEIDEIILG